MTTDPNSRQVGGDHYARQGMQHWDLAALAGAGYFAGQVTKYTERHAKKNGRQDLEKALHFAEKMDSLATEAVEYRGWWVFRHPVTVTRVQPVDPEVVEAIRDYSVESGLTAIQERIFELCFVQPHKTGEIVALCRKHLDREYGPTVVQPDPPDMRERVPIPTLQIGEGTEGTEGTDYAHAPSQSSMVLEESRPGTPDDGGHHEVNVYVEELVVPEEVELALTQDLQALIEEQRAADVVAPFKPRRAQKQRG